MYLPRIIGNGLLSIVPEFHGIYDQVVEIYVDMFRGQAGLSGGSLDAILMHELTIGERRNLR